jgi:hypothetical protein
MDFSQSPKISLAEVHPLMKTMLKQDVLRTGPPFGLLGGTGDKPNRIQHVTKFEFPIGWNFHMNFRHLETSGSPVPASDFHCTSGENHVTTRIRKKQWMGWKIIDLDKS